jgi:hypothetical protein
VNIVDNAGEVGEYSSIALQDGETPLIAYYDRTNGDLKYATSTIVKGYPLYLPAVRK